MRNALSRLVVALSLPAALLLSGCVSTQEASLSSSGYNPPMQWDARPEARVWTATTLAAVADHDPSLAGVVPADIDVWCPGYATASVQDRRAFWAGLMSAVARYESAWNPTASGAGGRYIGVMQISPRTADYHQCDADTAHELKDGADNLSCATQILASAVSRDGLVSGDGNRGIGRDWMPMRDAEKRAAMAEWTRAQPYCRATTARPRFTLPWTTTAELAPATPAPAMQTAALAPALAQNADPSAPVSALAVMLSPVPPAAPRAMAADMPAALPATVPAADLPPLLRPVPRPAAS